MALSEPGPMVAHVLPASIEITYLACSEVLYVTNATLVVMPRRLAIGSVT